MHRSRESDASDGELDDAQSVRSDATSARTVDTPMDTDVHEEDHWNHYAKIVKLRFEEEFDETERSPLEVSRIVRELNETFLQVYKDEVKRYENALKDPVTRSIIRTRRKFMDEEEMGSSEALDAAIERRKHLILKYAPKDWFETSDDDNTDDDNVENNAPASNNVIVGDRVTAGLDEPTLSY